MIAQAKEILAPAAENLTAAQPATVGFQHAADELVRPQTPKHLLVRKASFCQTDANAIVKQPRQINPLHVALLGPPVVKRAPLGGNRGDTIPIMRIVHLSP